MFRPIALASFVTLGCVGSPAAEVSFRISDAKKSPVADAVVSLVPLDAPALPSPAGKPAEIVQENLEFRPYVTAVSVGTPIVFPNRDTVQHHVYSAAKPIDSSSKPKNFELPLYVPGKAETVIFDQPGSVVIGCNIHDTMSAHVLVLETPFFAKTSDDGAVTLSAPAGRYRAEVWHPRLAKNQTREIALTESAPAPLAFTLALKAAPLRRHAPQTRGGGYR